LWITRHAEFTGQAHGTNRAVGKIPKPANPIVSPDSPCLNVARLTAEAPSTAIPVACDDHLDEQGGVWCD
jgi:hypothetical protein